MGPFRLSSNAEELAAHMRGHLAAVKVEGNFYTYFQLEYRDCGYEEGWIEFTHKATAFDINRYGTVHGGVTGILLDTAMGLTAYETGVGNWTPTMDLHVNYLKPMHPGDELVIRAEVMSAGKRTCVVRGFIFVDGELKVMANTTCRIYSDSKPEKPVLAE